MKTNKIRKKFMDSQLDGKLYCTTQDLHDYLLSGMIFRSGEKYYTGDGETIKIQIPNDFEYNLQEIINTCIEFSKKEECKKIYVMNKERYNNYKEKNKIINIKDKEYYKVNNFDVWLVNVI